MRFVQAAVLALGVAMYVVVLAFSGQLATYYNVQWFFVIAGGWNLLLLATTIIAIVDAARKISAGKTRQLGSGALIVKLASIPFFVLNFCVLVVLFFGSFAILLFGGPVLWVVVAVGSVLTYLTMLGTSVYGWAAVVQLRRDRTIGIGLTVLYSLLLLVFVTDIAASAMLFGHSRRRPRLALVVVLVVGGLTAVVAGLLGLFAFNFIIAGLDVQPGFDSLGLIPITLIIAGGAVVVGTLVVSIVLRSGLRLEAQRAATPVEVSTERDASNLVPAS